MSKAVGLAKDEYLSEMLGFTVTFLPINPLLDDKILDWSKLKQIAYGILKCI